MAKRHRLSRRMFLGAGIGAAGLVSNALALSTGSQGKQGIAYASSHTPSHNNSSMDGMGGMPSMAGMVNSAAMATTTGVPGLPFTTPVPPSLNGGYDPSKFITHFETGTVQQIGGKATRVFNLVSVVKNIVVAVDNATRKPIMFQAWAFGTTPTNAQVPGPTLRCKQGETVLINYTNNTPQTHSIHFHGIHNASNDGSLQAANPGQKVQYQFIADPAGLMAYHCHVLPSVTHIGKGLYGAMVVEPTQPRTPAVELVLVMNAFAIRSPDKNDVYAFNTVANHYGVNPFPLPLNSLIRIYLLNMVCSDPALSFHLHANFFNLFPAGTQSKPTELNDMVTVSLLERYILEFTYKTPTFTPGQYMFHSHDNPGEMGMFGLFNLVNTQGIPGTS